METEEEKQARLAEQAKLMKQNWSNGGWNRMARHLSGQDQEDEGDKKKPSTLSAWLGMGNG